VTEAELLGPLGVSPHGATVAAQLCLREHHADIHERLSTRLRSRHTGKLKRC
jgi:hypothetical protein